MRRATWLQSLAIGIAILTFTGTGLAQTTWWVDDDNCPGPGAGTPLDPFCTIQAAINAATSGDTIFVRPGVYNERIDFLNKQIELRSTQGSTMTIIDGFGLSESLIRIVGGQGPATVLQGFTITRGGSAGPADDGGGLLCSSSSPTVQECIFVENESSEGGAIACTNGSNAQIINCHFYGNKANAGITRGGGAIFCNASNPSVINCVFSGNDVSGASMQNDGGAIYNINSNPLLVNCSFSRNTVSGSSSDGGGISNVNSNPTIVNCIFWENADDGATTEAAQIHQEAGSAAVVSYTCIQGLSAWVGNGNIGTDPQYVDADGSDNIVGTMDDNLHLGMGSPCTDAGDSSAVALLTDLDGLPRRVDDPSVADTGAGPCPIVDMGAYEGQSDENQAPTCSGAYASTPTLWPPNHQFVPITVQGVVDGDCDPVSITITSIHQDEPVSGRGAGNTSPDGAGVGTDTAMVRAERAGNGNGRVYHIGFTASDGRGGTCSGEITVCVPHNQGNPGCGDGGPLYDSTVP